MPGIRASLVRLASSLACAVALAAPAQSQVAPGDKPPVNAGPYVPSPQSVVAEMLQLADIRPDDFVVDLGSGDGRIVLTAAKVYGARGFGVEIVDDLVRRSNEAARNEGLADRVRFVTQDLFATDISRATVLTMYLLPDTVNLLSDKLLRELRPGARVLSHDYPLSGWIPDHFRDFDLEDKVKISGVTRTTVYLYVVPAPVAGSWTVALPPELSRQRLTLDIVQQRQKVGGMARLGGRELPFDDIRLRGTSLSFRLALDRQRTAHFQGAVEADRIDGTVQVGRDTFRWRATRPL